MTDITPDNPFLSPFTEAEAIPFSRIKEEHFIPALRRADELSRRELEAIATCPDEPTVENTLIPLEYSGEMLSRVIEVFEPLASTLASDSMMAIDAEATPILVAHSIAIFNDRRLWERVKTLYDKRQSLDLDGPTLRLLDNLHRTFVNGGAALEGEARTRFFAIMERRSELSRIFGENIVKEMRQMRLTGTDRAELDGIPQHILADLEETAEGWSLPISQPAYVDIMRLATNRPLRRRLYNIYGRRCSAGEYNNLPILAEEAALRREAAAILGFTDFASWRVEQNMARTPENVLTLLDRLRQAYLPALPAEMAELEAFAGHKIEPWDYAYESRRLRAERYDFDAEAMKPYFELSNVMKGIFALAKTLYGVDFEEITGTVDVYHPDVRVYRVSSTERGYLGLIYYDFFARPTKRPGAWMTEFRGQKRLPDGTDIRPYINIVANIAPTPDGEPTLLLPREVETLLHETGHGLHGLLSDCRYPSQAGTSVRRDFVELPSQMNEGFMTRPEFLDIAARHHTTGQRVPDALVAGLKRTATFGAAYACLRQLGFGYLDMAWHTLRDEASAAAAASDPIAFERRAVESVKIFDEPEGVAISPAFSHIFSGGYSAGYYSYKWAEVLAADAFEAIAPADDRPLDLDAARRFASCILSRGDTDDPATLYRNFRGRDADPDALLRRDFPDRRP